MSQLTEVLVKALSEMEIAVEPQQYQLFEQYYQLLVEWNQKINLTAITEPSEVAIKHFADSLACLKYVPLQNGYKLFDIGTGAGFPAVPLKIVKPGLQLTLVDSLRKRTIYLQELVNKLQLSAIDIMHARAEELGHNTQYRQKADIVVARAVAKLNVLAELCLPFVTIGGCFVALKGPDGNNEAQQASQACEKLGATIEAIHSFTLPRTGDERTLVVIRKRKSTSLQYPRKPGTPEKNPL